MIHSPLHRIIAGAILTIAILGVLRYKPWQREQAAGDGEQPREQLKVGFLPVT